MYNALDQHNTFKTWRVVIIIYYVLLVYVAKFPDFAQIITRAISPLLFIAVFMRFGVRRLHFPNEFYLWIALIIWSLTGFFIIKSTQSFVRYEQILIATLLIMYVIIALQNHTSVVEAVFTGIIIGSILTFFNDIIANNGNIMAIIRSSRLASITGNANVFGFLMLYGIFCVAFFWNNRKNKWLLIILIAILSFGILLSASRKSFLSVVIFILLWAWYTQKDKMKNPITILVLFAVIFFTIQLSLDFFYENTNIGKRLTATNEVTEDQKRKKLVVEAWELFEAHPIYGVGLGNFSANSRFRAASHNEVMELLSTVGFPGFLLYVFMYYYLWKRRKYLLTVVKDSTTIYRLRLIAPIVLTLFFLGLGSTNFTDIIAMSIVISMSAYTCQLSRQYSTDITLTPHASMLS